VRRALAALAAIALGAVPLAGFAESSPLDSETLAGMIEHTVRSRADETISSVELPSLAAFELTDARSYDVSISAHPDQDMLGWVPLTITVSDRGQVLRQGVITARVHAERAVVVAARALRPGHVLGPNDLHVETRPLAELPEGWLEMPAPALGKVLRRSLPPGAVLRDRHFEEGPAVSRGDRVQLVLRHGALRIDAFGRALEEGRTGDSIRVRSQASKRTVEGTLGPEGVVHVDL